MPSTRTPARHPLRSGPAAPDEALDDALDRVRELSLRLWAVRSVHRPRRGLLGVRCSSCGRPHPCETWRAVTR